MKIRAVLFTLLSASFCLFGTVEHSILPHMDSLIITDLEGKISPAQKEELDVLLLNAEKRLRIISFNMLFNHPWAEKNLERIHRWKIRKNRVIEYLLETKADIIGSQELQQDQIDDLMAALGNQYCYYGKGPGDIAAIFYRPERVELLEGHTYYYSETPSRLTHISHQISEQIAPLLPQVGSQQGGDSVNATRPHPAERQDAVTGCASCQRAGEKCGLSTNSFGRMNTFAVCRFKDQQSGEQFMVINTHLAFGNVKRREYEAEKLREFIQEHVDTLPLFVTGDFNTFPFRQDIDIPFLDGQQVVKSLEEASLKETMHEAAFGHFGPLSSTNFSIEEKRAFCSPGIPGVILDHIFVNDKVKVLAHGIDPARVDGHFPSDHFPVIIDVLLKPDLHEKFTK